MGNRISHWQENLQSFVQRVRTRWAKRPRQAAPQPIVPRKSLVKNRPESLEQRYEILDHEELADEVFSRLKAKVFEALGPVGYLHEAGRIAPGRPYFFVKPLGAKGFLFERSGKGWVVTPAEKIVGRDLFLRDQAPLDVVTLFLAKDRVAFPRVKSVRGGDSLLAFSVYEQRLLNQIGVGAA